eukprot:6143436-Pyramimonas_sp.AAC.1
MASLLQAGELPPMLIGRGLEAAEARHARNDAPWKHCASPHRRGEADPCVDRLALQVRAVHGRGPRRRARPHAPRAPGAGLGGGPRRSKCIPSSRDAE